MWEKNYTKIKLEVLKGEGGGEGWLQIKISGNEKFGKTLPSKVKLEAKTGFKNV